MKNTSLMVIWVTAVLCFLSATPRADARDTEIRMGLDVRYDDNIFQYSDTDLNRFNPDLPKFSAHTSTDDVIWMPSLRMSYRFRQPMETRLIFRVEPKFHQKNSSRDYQVYTFRIDQELPSRYEVGLRYLLVPQFFLRSLLIRPAGTTYADADFQIHSVKLTLGKTFTKRVTGEVSGLYERKDYNSNFDERDTNVLGGGIEVQMRPHRTLRIAVGGDYEVGTARGENDAALNSDISYDQWSAHISSTARLIPRLTVAFDYTFESKDFTTALPNDANHSGRHDNTHTEAIQLRTHIANSWNAHVSYERIDKSSNRSGVDLEFAGFSENRVTMGTELEF